MTDKLNDAPESKPYAKLWAARIDMELQRNVLLNYIHDVGLDEGFVAYLEHALAWERQVDRATLQPVE